MMPVSAQADVPLPVPTSGPQCVSYTDRSGEPELAISVQVCGGPELAALFAELVDKYLSDE